MTTITDERGEAREMLGFVCFDDVPGFADKHAPDPSHNWTLIRRRRHSVMFGPNEEQEANNFAKENGMTVLRRVGRKV